jgi:hypothetical protein
MNQPREGRKKMMKTNVTTNNGKRINLTTDDTLTLAFPQMEESTPATLRAIVCEKSLRRIERTTGDSNERGKVQRALALELQLSSHGMGKKSAQVFDASKLVLDYNL